MAVEKSRSALVQGHWQEEEGQEARLGRARLVSR